MNSRGVRHFGIAFSTTMIEAILDGLKTETRRLASDTSPLSKALPGDILWVKEGFEVLEWMAADRRARIRYLTRCPCDGVIVQWPDRLVMGKLGAKLPRFMPREASRINLTLAERLREPLLAVDDAGAVAEGISLADQLPHEILADGSWRTGARRERYLSLWDKINAQRGYGCDAEPEVDVLRFGQYSSS
ncbi:hypothetical protein D3C71_156220 [compost metagenome]